MTTEPNNVSKEAIISAASGMLLMALFTTIWSIVAEYEIQGNDYGMVIVVFSLFSVVFVTYAMYLFAISKRLPKLGEEAQKQDGKSKGNRFGLIFVLEGVAIFITVNVLKNLHLDAFVIPAIALIVGLHFYPMAKIFKRKIDYYFASWTCIVAIVGFIMVIMQSPSIPVVSALVSIGVALATTGYGIYMLQIGRQIAKRS
jgi:hypothetical protein